MLINCSWLTQTHTHTHTYIGTQHSHTHIHTLSLTHTNNTLLPLFLQYLHNCFCCFHSVGARSAPHVPNICTAFPPPSSILLYSTFPLCLPLFPLLCTGRQCVVYVKRLRFCGRAIFGQFHTSCNRSCSVDAAVDVITHTLTYYN